MPLLQRLRRTEKGERRRRRFPSRTLPHRADTGGPRRQRPAAPGPEPPQGRGCRPGGGGVLPFLLIVRLQQPGEASARHQRGARTPPSDAEAGECLSLRPGALTAARVEAPRPPPRSAAFPLPGHGAALAHAASSSPPTAKLMGRGRGGDGPSGAGLAACTRTRRGQLRARGAGGERPSLPTPREAEACPGALGRALTSCSEQRKISVQRPVQQPMVAAARAESRRFSAASLPR